MRLRAHSGNVQHRLSGPQVRAPTTTRSLQHFAPVRRSQPVFAISRSFATAVRPHARVIRAMLDRPDLAVGRDSEEVFRIVFALEIELSFGSTGPSGQVAANVPRVKVLNPRTSMEPAVENVPFEQGLREFRWTPDKDIIIDHRYAETELGRLPEPAAEPVKLRVGGYRRAPAARHTHGATPHADDTHCHG